MSTRDLVWLVVALATVGCADATVRRSAEPVAATTQTPRLGQPITAEQAATWDISVLPDGTGLPPGSGNAVAGALVYEQKCQSCHAAKGAGQPNDRLAGGQGTLASQAPVRTVGSYWPYATTVFDYVRRAMPYLQPHSLTGDEVYALTAYLLHLNGIVGETAEMNAGTLPAVTMPNRDGFVVVYPPAPGSR
jgi:cytochrome c